MVHDIDLLCSIRLFIQLVNAGTYIVVQQYCIILIPLLAHHGCNYLAKSHTKPPTGTGEDEASGNAFGGQLLFVYHEGRAVEV